MASRSKFLAGAVFGVMVSLSMAAYAALGGADGVLIPYRGHLDTNGAPANGDYTFRFDLHDAETGGTACSSVGTLADKVATVNGGVFSVVIGPVPETCVAGKQVWVDVMVKGPSEGSFSALTGRQRVYPTVGALTSGRADFLVSGFLSVVGNATANRLVVGDVIGSTDYRGVAFNGLNNINSYALIQSVTGSETLINAPSGGNVNLRINNSTRLAVDGSTVDVTGRLQRDEYQVSCAEGLSSLQNPYCCRLNVRTGATDCKRSLDTQWGNWNAISSPFGAGSAGPYSLSCTQWVGGVNYPSCCRADSTGHVDCAYNTNNVLQGAWTPAASPF
jgi:hypothetical protein